MVSGMPEFEGIYWPSEVEYRDTDGIRKGIVEMSGVSERQNTENTYTASSSCNDKDDDAYRNINGSSSSNITNAVVSDANARDSKQLLYAHVYNYLIKNGHYATARQFLREADLPLSSRNENEVMKADMSNTQDMDQEHPPDLVPTRLQLDSNETLLLEWWNCFCRLRDHVEQTPLEELRTDPLEVPTAFLPKIKEPASNTDEDNPLGESKSI